MTSRNFQYDAKRRAAVLQGHHCAYCALPFGTVVSWKSRDTAQNLVGDHLVPYSMGGDSGRDNLVAACQVCNSLKGDRVFESMEHAARTLLSERYARRIAVLFIPLTAVTDDAAEWSREYSAWLCE